MFIDVKKGKQLLKLGIGPYVLFSVLKVVKIQ